MILARFLSFLYVRIQTWKTANNTIDHHKNSSYALPVLLLNKYHFRVSCFKHEPMRNQAHANDAELSGHL